MTQGRSRSAKTILMVHGAAALAAVFITSCRAPSPPKPAESVRALLETRVGRDGTEGPVYCRSDRICGSDVLPAFYRAREFRPAWVDDHDALEEADSCAAALALVTEDGLDPANYHLDAIEDLLAEIRAEAGKKRGKVSPDALVDLEMLLTDGFLLCGSHLAHGQVNPETIRSEWFIKGRVEDLAAVLEKGLASGDIAGALDSLRPHHAVYAGLKKAFRDYGIIAGRCGWPVFPPGPKLDKGARGSRVQALREALEARGFPVPSGTGDPHSFDAGLEESVKAFQRLHGLEPDGVVGSAVAAALNVSAAERMAQIRANLERWRWIPRDLGQKYILINIADFRVGVYENGREVLSMPAIVGTAFRRTPEFSGTMTYIELNPTWTIPPKLVWADIMPKYRKDNYYLVDNGIRVFKGWTKGAPEIDPDKVDWSRYSAANLPFMFRQDPGPLNSLGQIKFMFPNKFDIYLHDTPNRGLFSRAVRTFSSGCIRIADPLGLAEYLLREDPAWTRDKILEALEYLTTRVIVLKNPVPVHLLYWTAWLDDGGRVQFREDIYQRDAALYRALEERAAAPE